MSEHHSGADSAPDRTPGMEARGHSSLPDAAMKGRGQPATVGGHVEEPAGAWQGQAHGNAQACGQAGGYQGGHPGYAGQAGAPAAYGGPQGGPQGHGESMGPPSGQGHFMHGATGSMPPGYWRPEYVHPAPGLGYYAAPHRAAMHDGQYAGYPPPPPPPASTPDAFQAMHQGHAYGAAQGAGHAHGASMGDLMNEVANGGNGLSTLSKMLNFDDPDFWKGALVGAAAVLLLTSDSVQGALFGSGSNGNGGKEPSA